MQPFVTSFSIAIAAVLCQCSAASGIDWRSEAIASNQEDGLPAKYNKRNYTQRCHSVEACYCIRHTTSQMNDVCGWCESRQRGLVGSSDGPEPFEGECTHWIFSHKNCPVLHCPADYTFRWYMSLLMPSVLFGSLLLYAELNSLRQGPDPRDTFSENYGRQHNEQQGPEFMQLTRTLAEFKKGLWGNRAPMSSIPFQLYFSHRDMPSVMKSIAKSTSLSRMHKTILRYGFLVCLFLTVIGITPIFLDHPQFNVLAESFANIENISITLQSISGFLFSFYSLGRVGWWWEVMNAARIIQGRTHDIAMLVGGAVAAEDHGAQGPWWEAKWQLFRYEMLVFLFVFRPLAPLFQSVSFEDLEGAGFLEAEERFVLESSCHPRKVVLKWISLWVSGHVQDSQVRMLILDKVCGLRGACGTLHDTVDLRAPFSFEALMYCTVWLWMLTLPFRELSSSDDRRLVLEGGTVIATLRCVLICGVYLTLIDLLEAFKDPFGWCTDSMNVENIFLETESTILEFLTSPAPAGLGKVCKEELHMEKSPMWRDAPPQHRPNRQSIGTFDIESRSLGERLTSSRQSMGLLQ